jgi:uncharacterized membrane protein HdeD (DUF308 family)
MTNDRVNLWVVATAAGIVALGLTMLFIPNSEIGANARIAGWVLLGAGALEVAGAAARRRLLVRKIELMLGGVTVGAALLILMRPEAFPLIYVAITCLLVRGVGAVVAAALSRAGVRLWVLGRGAVDLALGLILLAGAPLSAVISIISGNRWPDRSGAVLTNFVALSMLATGLSLLGLALMRRRAAADEEPDA